MCHPAAAMTMQQSCLHGMCMFTEYRACLLFVLLVMSSTRYLQIWFSKRSASGADPTNLHACYGNPYLKFKSLMQDTIAAHIFTVQIISDYVTVVELHLCSVPMSTYLPTNSTLCQQSLHSIPGWNASWDITLEMKKTPAQLIGAGNLQLHSVGIGCSVAH